MKITALKLVVAISMSFSAVLTAEAAAPLYQVVDLGNLGLPGATPLALNNSGDVVGFATSIQGTPQNPGRTHGFYYHNGTMIDLGTLSNGDGSSASDINDAGIVVGTSSIAPLSTSTASHAFTYSNSTTTDIGTLSAPYDHGGWAYGINSLGQVVGKSVKNNNDTGHAWLYSGGVMTDLGTLGGASSTASAINDSGQIVGYAELPSSLPHAVIFSNGAINDLGTLGGTYSYGYDINATGQVVGMSQTLNSPVFLPIRHAFIYSGGVMSDLGTLGGSLSAAGAINDAGNAVGYSLLADEKTTHAFLYQDGTTYDLNTLLDSSGAGWMLDNAEDINNNGWIAAEGIFNNYTHAVLLIPVPEPSALILSMLGISGLFLSRRRGVCV